MSRREWTPEKPYVPFKRELPTTRTEALSLLRRLDDDIDKLTPEQDRRLRELYCLDDDRTVEERLRTGEIAAGMEFETDAINRLDREGEL